jgi:hypothetical protein
VAELAPVSWPDLIKRLNKLGFEGPYHGGKHPYMTKGNLVLTVPNPHRKETGRGLPLRHRAGIADWGRIAVLLAASLFLNILFN